MKAIKRWTTGIFSRVDWAVSQIENQEALINSTLKESREAVAKAKVRLGRLRQDGNKLRQRLQNEEQNVERWRERAAQVAKADEARAIDCLRRGRQAEQLRSQLQKRVREHEQVEAQLGKEVAGMEEQLAELVEKRNMMRSRQSCAEALSSIQVGSTDIGNEVDDIFDRWEIRITEKELSSECAINIDPLEESFASEEIEAELREELQQLIDTQN
ncbi:phage shock protein A (PspA) family protein [Malonomonas rubra DSM 5091]|uniref:Phage shock protein A (PspA) family protein n=1 Tax=Malonomonas rubra DSM 5091 TaxID=1122189 RepID=A0A1M6ISL2_MALRU|nr:PspA/IM30 family protein [Malonomonas rubra]SHJ37377.1 phage shock protein A (PspA) family protein [Malonomonas rubra DSM 5091]